MQYDFVENLVAGPAEWRHDDGRISEHHPIADTIDAAVLAFPEGWILQMNDLFVFASLRPFEVEGGVQVKRTGHTPDAIRRDLLALARLAWIAEGAEP